MSLIDAAELADRVLAKSHVRITVELAQAFLNVWAEQGLVTEVEPGRYRLTLKGRSFADGLRETGDTENAA